MADETSDRTFVSVDGFVSAFTPIPQSLSDSFDNDDEDDDDLLLRMSTNHLHSHSSSHSDTAAFMWDIIHQNSRRSSTTIHNHSDDLCVNIDHIQPNPASTSAQLASVAASSAPHLSVHHDTPSPLSMDSNDPIQPSSAHLHRSSDHALASVRTPAPSQHPRSDQSPPHLDPDLTAEHTNCTTQEDLANSSISGIPDEVVSPISRDLPTSTEQVLSMSHYIDDITQSQVDNPLRMENPHNADKLVLFSARGQLDDDELAALANATTSSMAESKLVCRLIETIQFQKKEMDTLKGNEKLSTENAVEMERRRFSESHRRRSLVINGLVSEVDRLTAVHNTNVKLQQQLQHMQRKQEDIVAYFQEFDEQFSLGDDVAVALDAVHGRVRELRRESAQRVASQDLELEEYAERLLSLERILAESQKRYQDVLNENENLKLRGMLDSSSGTESRSSAEEASAHSAPISNIALELDTAKQQLQEKDAELETLRVLVEKNSNGKKLVDEALLTLNVDLENATGKIKTLQDQRDDAEEKCREIHDRWVLDREQYISLSREMSETLVSAVHDLDAREDQISTLKAEIADRENAISSLRETVNQVERQLESSREFGAAKRRASTKDAGDLQSGSHTVAFDAIVESLRVDLSKAEGLLSKKASELAEAQMDARRQDDHISSLQRECDRLRSIAAAKAGMVDPENVVACVHDEDHGASFLRRLSARLGCYAENNHELVAKLVKRVEDLMKERTQFEAVAEDLRHNREQALHGLRSEMQAEISALKAQIAHLENVKDRAVEEREAAELKILQMSGEEEFTIGESLGELTISSAGGAWPIGEDDSISRRSSAFSAFLADDGVQWKDPIIAAAVQSVSNLIGTKNNLAARNRALREKLDNMINRLSTSDDPASSRALMIESRSLQDELAGIVDMQQSIIERLGTNFSGVDDPNLTEHSGRVSLSMHSGSRRSSGTARLSGRPYSIEEKTASRYGPGLAEKRPIRRTSISGAASFLREQLADTRALFSKKLEDNANLCGVVSELEQELKHLASEKKSIENVLETVSQNHEHFVHRLSDMVGTGKSTLEIEDRVRSALYDLKRMESEALVKKACESVIQKKLCNLGAQKRILSHMIHMYQSKYCLDLTTRSADELQSPSMRLRRAVRAVFAGVRFARLARNKPSEEITVLDISDHYQVPPLAAIGKVSAHGVSLMNAVVAISAVPRLEEAISAREAELGELRLALASLGNTTAHEEISQNDLKKHFPSAFMYDKDVMERKNDLSRRFGRIIKEKEELEVLLSQERKLRISSEAKTARCVDKMSTLKRRLAKAQSNSESRERTYKAAIRYMKSKADKAVGDDFNMDENAAPRVNHSSHVRKPQSNELTMSRNTNSLALLEGQLAQAEENLTKLDTSSETYKSTVKYIQRLQRAAQRLRQTDSSNAVPSSENRNLEAVLS